MSNDIAVRVEGLGKKYRLGHTVDLQRTFRETLTGLPSDIARKLTAPFRKKSAPQPAEAAVHPHHSYPSAEDFWALRDVNFEINRGDSVGIIGRNGAGKSTLLKILSRVTSPTTGRAEMHGRLASLLEVGTGFHPELTGRENIYLNGAILGMKKVEIDRKFDEIVDFAEVEQFLDTPVKRYSSGMYVRLAFGVAAHLEPEILIVDEVLAVGDLAFQKKCLGKMNEVSRQGRTVLFVSHNMDAVMKLCTRGIFLQNGTVTMDDLVDKTVQHYVDSAADAQTTFDIKPPANLSEVPGYATRLTIEDARTSQPTKAIPVGCPWQVRVHFKITRPLEHFIAAMGMNTNLGTALRTSWSKPQKIQPGEYSVVFKDTTLLLSPGQYGLTIGLSEHENSFHYADNTGCLTIAEYAEGIELTRLMHVGLLLNPLDISIEPV